jgi:hypothetical protein
MKKSVVSAFHNFYRVRPRLRRKVVKEGKGI